MGATFISTISESTFSSLTPSHKQTINTNIKNGYLYLVLPKDTVMNNYEKLGYHLYIYLQVDGKNEVVCIDNTPGVHVLKIREAYQGCECVIL